MDTTTVDTVRLAAPVVADATVTLITTILPYLTPWSIVIAGALWVFRAEIKVFLSNRGTERRQIMDDVAALKTTLEAHIRDESGFWDTYSKRLNRVEDKHHGLELQITDLAATSKAQHDAVLSKLSDLDEAIRDLRRP